MFDIFAKLGRIFVKGKLQGTSPFKGQKLELSRKTLFFSSSQRVRRSVGACVVNLYKHGVMLVSDGW